MVYTLTVHLYANDKPDSIDRIKAKLIEAARVYRKDRETVDWIVMQDIHDPRAFTIVERFENESVSASFPAFGLVQKSKPPPNAIDCNVNLFSFAESEIPSGKPILEDI
jgi:hypothetical protein